MAERKNDSMSQLRAEVAVERKKRKLVEARLLELLELLEPHLATKAFSPSGEAGTPLLTGLPFPKDG